MANKKLMQSTTMLALGDAYLQSYIGDCRYVGQSEWHKPNGRSQKKVRRQRRQGVKHGK